MAQKSANTGRGRGRQQDDQIAGYWERLQPEAELVYNGETREGEPVNEVIVYDDREDVGQRNPGIKVQFIVNGRRRKVTTFSFDDVDGLDELIEDLQQVRENL